jgi:hypothetical protein
LKKKPAPTHRTAVKNVQLSSPITEISLSGNANLIIKLTLFRHIVNFLKNYRATKIARLGLFGEILAEELTDEIKSLLMSASYSSLSKFYTQKGVKEICDIIEVTELNTFLSGIQEILLDNKIIFLARNEVPFLVIINYQNHLF